MNDDYRAVTARFRGIARSGSAFFVDRSRARGSGSVSIPRSLIHAADDGKLDGLFEGEEVTFRLRAWKAEELGFA